MSKPPISFRSYRIQNLEYKMVDEISNEDSPYLEGGFSLADDHKSGMVRQSVIIRNNKKKTVLKLSMVAFFDVLNDKLDEDELNGLLAQNGSAMLYPYVRSIVSIISSLDSPEVINLSSLNFIDAYNKSQHTGEKD